jgi:hypothetical protein
MLNPTMIRHDAEALEFYLTNAPPASFQEALSSNDWGPYLFSYAENQTAEHRAAFWVVYYLDVAPTPVEELWASYGAFGRENGEDMWSEELKNAVDFGELFSRRDAVTAQWYGEAVAFAEEVYAAFVGEVARNYVGGSNARYDDDAGYDDTDSDTAKFSQIEWRDVEASNAAILKATDAGGDIPFMHSDDGRMMFWADDADIRIWNAFWEKQANDEAVLGNIRVKSRGSLTSHGKIVVTGVRDKADFKFNLRRFSKKEIEFN